MNKIALEIKGLTFSNSQSGAYVMILGDKNSQRCLPIIIGGNEAQSIAMGIENVKGNRPLTHDLFKNFADSFGIEIKEVVINRFHIGVFYATLVCKKNDEIIMIDARPSDAIAIAVRCGCDISAYDSVMQEAGIIMDDADFHDNGNDENSEVENEPETEEQNDVEDLDQSDLESLLRESIENEDYEKAARIRDEIKKRDNDKE